MNADEARKLTEQSQVSGLEELTSIYVKIKEAAYEGASKVSVEVNAYNQDELKEELTTAGYKVIYDPYQLVSLANSDTYTLIVKW